jgi:hypothetical protein
MGGQDITNMASLSLAEQSPVPASAAANTLLLYSEAIKGFSFLSSLDDTGMRRKFQRDSVFVGKNTTGSSIPAFRAVYAIGSEDDVPLIAKARSNSVTTMPAIGITLEAIATGAYGRIMQIGLVENANTSAFTAGDILYVSSATAGVLVKTAPLWPNIRQEIGTILAVSATVGSVQVVARSMFNEGILDHGGLLGLADNDHTQYLLLAGGTMTGNIYGGDDFEIGAASGTCTWVFDTTPATDQVVLTSGALMIGDAQRVYFEASGTTQGTEYVSSDANTYLDLHSGGAVRTYGLDDDNPIWEAYSGANKILSVRRYSAGSPTVTRWDFPIGFHYYLNNVRKFASGADGVGVPINDFPFAVGVGFAAGVYYDGTHMVVDPDKNAGSGKVYIGATADDDIVANSFQTTTAGTEYVQSDAAGYQDYAAATAHRFTALIDIVTTTSTAGQITQGGTRILHSYGTGNLFLGDGAGNFTLSGANYNVAIGGNTLDALTSGDANVAVGESAGTDITSGLRNTLMGRYAGTNISTGTGNTCLGSQSGFTLSTVGGCVMIGQYAGYYETAANKLFVDNATRTNEADGRVKAPIYGVMAAAVDDQLLRFNACVEMLAGQVVDQVTKSAAYTATAGDYVILCDTDTAGAPFTITLPAAASHAGRVYYVKNTGTSGYDVTLDGDGAETVDGDATQTITDGECLLVVCDGTEWWVI